MVAEIKPTAALVGQRPEYRGPAEYVQSLDVLPLGRVVNDAKVTDHHAIIPTNADRHPVDKFNEDDRKIYDLVARRFLAVFHPEAVFENTRVETTVAGRTSSAPAASCCSFPAGGLPTARPPISRTPPAPTTTRAATSGCPSSSRARPPRSARSSSSARRPSRRSATTMARC